MTIGRETIIFLPSPAIVASPPPPPPTPPEDDNAVVFLENDDVGITIGETHRSEEEEM